MACLRAEISFHKVTAPAQSLRLCSIKTFFCLFALALNESEAGNLSEARSICLGKSFSQLFAPVSCRLADFCLDSTPQHHQPCANENTTTTTSQHQQSQYWNNAGQNDDAFGFPERESNHHTAASPPEINNVASCHFRSGVPVTSNSINSSLMQQEAEAPVKQRTVGVVEPRVVVRIPRLRLNNDEEREGVEKEKNRTALLSPEKFSSSAIAASSGNVRSPSDGYCITEKLPRHFKEALKRSRPAETTHEGSSNSKKMKLYDPAARNGSRKRLPHSCSSEDSSECYSSSSSFCSSSSSSSPYLVTTGETPSQGAQASEDQVARRWRRRRQRRRRNRSRSKHEKRKLGKEERKVDRCTSDRGEGASLDGGGGQRRQAQQQAFVRKLHVTNPKCVAQRRKTLSAVRKEEDRNQVTPGCAVPLRQQQQGTPKPTTDVSQDSSRSRKPEDNKNKKVPDIEGGASNVPEEFSNKDSRGAIVSFQHSGGCSDKRWLFCEFADCWFWTRKPDRMARHRRCHNSSGAGSSKKYSCPDCNQRFQSLAKLLKHDRNSHTGVADYECRVCDQEVTDIKSHMKVSGGFSHCS